MSKPTVVDRACLERAAAISPAKFAAGMTGGVGDGYWIDGQRYFFTVTEADSEGRIAPRPKIADAATGAVSPAIDAGTLAALISGHSERQIDDEALVTARYDMPDAGTLVAMIGQDAYHIALDGPALVKADTLDPVPALYSPDGKHSVFLKDHAVWVKDRATGTARQLSPDGERYHAYGAGPESSIMPISGRLYPMPNGLWSADSEWFVTHRLDERHMPESGLVEHAPAGGKRAIPHVYKVGGPDAETVTLEYTAFHLPSGRSVTASDRRVILLAFSPFTPKQCWFVGDSLYFFDWSRFSEAVALVEMRLDSGAIREVKRETTEGGWIDLHPAIAGQPISRVLPGSNELIWYSQADGHGHLYLHDLASGALKNRITDGDWVVRDILHVDEDRRRILFAASGFADAPDAVHRRLCAIDFDGSGFETLLDGGDLSASPDPVSAYDQMKPFRPPYASRSASPDGRHIVLQDGAADAAGRTILFDVADRREVELAKSNIDALWTAPRPEPFEVLAADGVTKLYGALYFPTGFDPAKSYPLVDYIYPGPQVNWFVRRHPNSMALILQSVVELGMVGMMLETRGMPNRDRAFHQAGQGRMLEPQLSDHVAAVEQICQRHTFLDRDRIGIFGMSGGGHATARAMFDYPEVYKVGVSVCGNHDNRNYIAHWIDKYGGRPGTPERDDQANVGAAHKLQGKLFLIHGDMDENVHPAHTLALSAALIEAGKDFDQLILPGVNHGVLIESPYAVQKMWTYFARHLIGAEPSTDFVLRWTPAETGAAMRLAHEIAG